MIEQNRSEEKWSFKLKDLIIILISTVISFFLTNYFNKESRAIQYRPYLNFGLTKLNNDPTHYGILMRNLGNGPAVIEKTVLYIDGKEAITIDKDYKGNFLSEFFDKTDIDKTCAFFMSSQGLLTPGDIIFPNSENAFLTLPTRVVYTERNRYWDNFDRVYKIKQELKGINVNNIKIEAYLMNEAYTQCNRSFLDFFSNVNRTFEIGVVYKSLSDDNMSYGIEQGQIKRNLVRIIQPVQEQQQLEILQEFTKSNKEVSETIRKFRENSKK